MVAQTSLPCIWCILECLACIWVCECRCVFEVSACIWVCVLYVCFGVSLYISEHMCFCDVWHVSGCVFLKCLECIWVCTCTYGCFRISPYISVLVCLCLCMCVQCTTMGSLCLCHPPAVKKGGAALGCLVSCEQSPGAEGWA